MKFISQLLTAHLQRYPRMQLEDIYKLLHQAAMGPEHAVADAAVARERLLAETQQLGTGPADPRVDAISPDGRLARIHLRTYMETGGTIDDLASAFIDTANNYPPAPDKLARFCGCLGDLAAAGGIPFGRDAVEAYFGDLAARGYPAIHHSQTYRELYHPAYRVVAVEYIADR
jgi:hypothetical protein